MKRFFISAFLLNFLFAAFAATPILGTNEATVDQLYNFVKTQNSSFDREIAEQFIAVSEVYGLRGDIALCQSIVETGWFKYTGGTAVTPDDHNYCGLGVTTLGEKGCQFSTVKEGVTAQIQHLYAYACTKSIPSGETLIDPRFKYVTRGCAPNWEDLGGKWAVATDYGEKILALYVQMMGSAPTTTASLTASKTSVTLSAACGGTSRGTSVTITGQNLTDIIYVNSSSSAFTVTKSSSWNDYTGGGISIALNTALTAGTYTGYIAVQSGTGSSMKRVEINCTGTLSGDNTGGDTPTSTVPSAVPNSFATDWSYSAASGTSTSWMNPANDLTRNMALKDNKLYVVQRDTDNGCGYIRIVNALTGALSGSLPTTGLANDAYMFSSVANMGGTIVASNLVTSASGTLKVYSWSSDTATPTLVLETTNHGARSGDLMSASGTITSGKLYFASNTGYEGKVYVYTVTNGKASATPSVITLKDAKGATYNLGGGFAVIEIKANSDGTFWATGKNGAPALFSATGTLIRELAATSLDNNLIGTCYTPFSFGQFTLAAAVAYTTGVQQGYLNLINISSGEASATKVKSFPVLGASGVSNGTFVSTALAQVENNKVHLWVLIPKQGVAKYTATAPTGIDGISVDSDAQIVMRDGVITVENGQPAGIMLVAMTGSVVAQADEAIDASMVNSGIYIAVARLADGTTITRKMAIR